MSQRHKQLRNTKFSLQTDFLVFWHWNLTYLQSVFSSFEPNCFPPTNVGKPCQLHPRSLITLWFCFANSLVGPWFIISWIRQTYLDDTMENTEVPQQMTMAWGCTYWRSIKMLRLLIWDTLKWQGRISQICMRLWIWHDGIRSHSYDDMKWHEIQFAVCASTSRLDNTAKEKAAVLPEPFCAWRVSTEWDDCF